MSPTFYKDVSEKSAPRIAIQIQESVGQIRSGCGFRHILLECAALPL